MKLQTVAIALVVSLGVLALAAPVMAAAADVERCSGLAGLWRDIAQARDKGSRPTCSEPRSTPQRTPRLTRRRRWTAR